MKLSITLQEVVLTTAGTCLLHFRKSSLRLQELVYYTAGGRPYDCRRLSITLQEVVTSDCRMLSITLVYLMCYSIIYITNNYKNQYAHIINHITAYSDIKVHYCNGSKWRYIHCTLRTGYWSSGRV